MNLALYDPTSVARRDPPDRVDKPDKIEGPEKGYSPWANIEALHEKMSALFAFDSPLEIPVIKRDNHVLLDPPTSMIPFTAPAHLWTDACVHFFRNDYRFECVWNNPERYTKRLLQHNPQYVLSPDFSAFVHWPRMMQMWNVYRNRWLGAYMRHHGLRVIPSITWADEVSYQYCFLGVPYGSTVAVATAGSMKTWEEREAFEKGFNAMLEAIRPARVLVYGRMWFTTDTECLEFPRTRDNGKPEQVD